MKQIEVKFEYLKKKHDFFTRDINNMLCQVYLLPLSAEYAIPVQRIYDLDQKNEENHVFYDKYSTITSMDSNRVIGEKKNLHSDLPMHMRAP